jgi:uncharacterized protein
VIRLAVVDTNVLVSGMMSLDEMSPPARIFDAMVDGKLRFLLSESLLAEYRRVLLRPHMTKRHGLTEEDVDRLLLEIVLNAVIRNPVVEIEAGTETHGDEHIVALLKTMPGSVLVTGDRRLAGMVAAWCEVATPAAFAATLG